jgi:hypothetical protein
VLDSGCFTETISFRIFLATVDSALRFGAHIFKTYRLAGLQQLMPVIPATQEAEIRRIEVQSQPRQIVLETLPQKYPTQKRAGGVAQMVKYLPSKCEAKFKSQSHKKKKKCR